MSRAHSPSLTDAKCVGLNYFLIFIIVTESLYTVICSGQKCLEMVLLVSLSSTLEFTELFYEISIFTIIVSPCIVFVLYCFIDLRVTYYAPF